MLTAQEPLERARAGELEEAGVDGSALAGAVHAFVEAGDASSALELVYFALLATAYHTLAWVLAFFA